MTTFIALLNLSALALNVWSIVRLASARRQLQRGQLAFQDRFPGQCPLCSLRRYGREHGIPHAFGPAPEHPCPERDRSRH
jgi:hypothetical protein